MTRSTTRKTAYFFRSGPAAALLPAVGVWLGLSLAASGPASAQPARPTTRDQIHADMQKTFGFVPPSMKGLPDAVLPSFWAQLKGFEMADTALPGKVKQLIGLAVSAQLSCPDCVYAYRQCSIGAGASPAELGETVTIAAQARLWSTHLNGTQTDETRLRADLKKLIDNVTRAAASKAPAPPPVAVVDSRSALQDIQQSFGFVPEFMRNMAPEMLTGAWLGMRDVEMNPGTALPGKYKSLISLAVASQIPCRFCIIADTEFARLEGASEREIREAVAMAAQTRNTATLIDGIGVDSKQFRRDIDRLSGVNGKTRAGAKPPTSKRSGLAHTTDR